MERWRIITDMIYVINHREYDQPALLDQAREWSLSAENWLADIGHFLLEWFNEEEHVHVFTSGSTGDPKPITLKKDAMRQSAAMTASHFHLEKNDTALLCLPVKFIAGKMMIVRAITQGWHLIIRPPSSNPMRDVHEKIRFAAFTPMQVDQIIRENVDALKMIDVIIIGGAVVSAATESVLIEHHQNCFATYGMTETITHIAVRKLMPGNDVYEALPGVQCDVDGENCLRIGAPHIEEIIQTNDVVELLDASHFRFIGRRDNVINSGGIKLSPELLEKKIGHIISHSFFLVKKQDDFLGEKMVMYIECEDCDDSRKIELIEQLKLIMSPYEIPKEIIFVKAFERTATDKIIRKNYDL